MSRIWLTGIVLILGLNSACTKKEETPSPETQAPTQERASSGRVFFVSPQDNTEVPSKLKVVMGVEGKGVRPAGEDPADLATGHHHLIIDGKPIAQGEVIPTDDKHIHFGKGQTETEVTLTPGPHTLTLQFADGAHRSYGEEFSATIKVKVK